MKPTTDIKKAESWQMFDEISPKYDLLNQLLSFGLHNHWRSQLIHHFPKARNLSVLDLATGTADVLISAAQSKDHTITHAVGIDMANKMLDVGREKLIKLNLQNLISLKHGDATRLKFEDNQFDVTSMSFGIRNVDDPTKVLKEMYRVLKPGGKTLILEFSLPQNQIVRTVHLFYLRHMVPLIGSFFSGHKQAYRYLNQTIETFAYGEDFLNLMRSSQFKDVKAHSLLFGTATIYEGLK